MALLAAVTGVVVSVPVAMVAGPSAGAFVAGSAAVFLVMLALRRVRARLGDPAALDPVGSRASRPTGELH